MLPINSSLSDVKKEFIKQICLHVEDFPCCYTIFGSLQKTVNGMGEKAKHVLYNFFNFQQDTMKIVSVQAKLASSQQLILPIMLLHAQIASVNAHQTKIKRRSLVLQHVLVSETITFFRNHLTICVVVLTGAIPKGQRSLVRFRPRSAQNI